MASFDATTLSTAAGLKKLEYEINVSDSSITNKIEMAKRRLRSRITVQIKNTGYYNDYASGDEYIDQLLNPEIFAEASDYLCLFYWFADLEAGNNDDQDSNKKEFYDRMYEEAFQDAVQQMQLDTNLDGTANVYENDGFQPNYRSRGGGVY